MDKTLKAEFSNPVSTERPIKDLKSDLYLVDYFLGRLSRCTASFPYHPENPYADSYGDIWVDMDLEGIDLFTLESGSERIVMENPKVRIEVTGKYRMERINE